MRQTSLSTRFSILLLLFLFPLALSAGDTCRIRGHLAGVADGYAITVYRSAGRTLDELGADTLRSGRFSISFRLPEEEMPVQCQLFCDSGYFSTSFANLWLAPGVDIEVEGDSPHPCSWRIGSPLAEQRFEQRLLDDEGTAGLDFSRVCAQLSRLYPRLWPAQGDERKRLEAERAALEARRDSLVDRKLLAYVGTLERTARVDTAWMKMMYDLARNCFFDKDTPTRDRVCALFRKRLSPARQDSPMGREMAAFLFPPEAAGEGDAMADGELLAMDGTRRRLSGYLSGGKYLLLDFWSAGCGPCVMAFPELKEFAAAHAEEFVAVSISIDPEETWRKASQTYNLADSVSLNDLKGETGLAARYGVNGIPHYVVISPAGQIVKVQTGYGKGLFPRLWDEVKREEK